MLAYWGCAQQKHSYLFHFDFLQMCLLYFSFFMKSTASLCFIFHHLCLWVLVLQSGQVAHCHSHKFHCHEAHKTVLIDSNWPQSLESQAGTTSEHSADSSWKYLLSKGKGKGSPGQLSPVISDFRCWCSSL